VSRLGSTAARLKFKGIDGGPHKQRSVWFNSMLREEQHAAVNAFPGLVHTARHAMGAGNT